MNRCSDNLTGSPSFTISTEKQKDGSFCAKCDSIPALPTATGKDEIDAIRNCRMAVERHMMSGGKK